MLWLPAKAKVSNVALALEYSLLMALALQRLDTPSLKQTMAVISA